MISKIRYKDGREYICDGCGKAAARFQSYTAARKIGWGISYFRTKCYCPKCAPLFRHTGGLTPQINKNA